MWFGFGMCRNPAHLAKKNVKHFAFLPNSKGPFTQEAQAHLCANFQTNPLMLLTLHACVAKCSASWNTKHIRIELGPLHLRGVWPRSHRTRKQICVQTIWCFLQLVWTLLFAPVCSIICVRVLWGAPRPVWTWPKEGVWSLHCEVFWPCDRGIQETETCEGRSTSRTKGLYIGTCSPGREGSPWTRKRKLGQTRSVYRCTSCDLRLITGKLRVLMTMTGRKPSHLQPLDFTSGSVGPFAPKVFVSKIMKFSANFKEKTLFGVNFGLRAPGLGSKLKTPLPFPDQSPRSATIFGFLSWIHCWNTLGLWLGGNGHNRCSQICKGSIRHARMALPIRKYSQSHWQWFHDTGLELCISRFSGGGLSAEQCSWTAPEKKTPTSTRKTGVGWNWLPLTLDQGQWNIEWPVW